MFDNDTNADLLCEAESGLGRDLPGKPRTFILSETQVSTLAQAGFIEIAGAGNNYQQIVNIKNGDYSKLAKMLLGVLYDVYGANGAPHLDLQGNSVHIDDPLLYRECNPVT